MKTMTEAELSWNVENSIGELLRSVTTIDGEEYRVLNSSRSFMQRRRYNSQQRIVPAEEIDSSPKLTAELIGSAIAAARIAMEADADECDDPGPDKLLIQTTLGELEEQLARAAEIPIRELRQYFPSEEIAEPARSAAKPLSWEPGMILSWAPSADALDYYEDQEPSLKIPRLTRGKLIEISWIDNDPADAETGPRPDVWGTAKVDFDEWGIHEIEFPAEEPPFVPVQAAEEISTTESFRRFCASATDEALSRQGIDLMVASPMRSVWWAEMSRRGLPT